MENIEIVVPSSLQMGWTESSPFFCSCTITVWDLAEDMMNDGSEGDPHPLEQLCCPPEQWEKTDNENNICKYFISQLEVYLDDFIMMTQVLSPDELLRYSRKLLHAIHMVFPPLLITYHKGKDLISVNKLEDGDLTPFIWFFHRH